MGLIRSKRFRKTLSFYVNAGLLPPSLSSSTSFPLHFLVDSAFITAVREAKIMIRPQLEKIYGNKVEIDLTECSIRRMREEKEMGAERHIAQINEFNVFPCGCLEREQQERERVEKEKGRTDRWKPSDTSNPKNIPTHNTHSNINNNNNNQNHNAKEESKMSIDNESNDNDDEDNDDSDSDNDDNIGKGEDPSIAAAELSLINSPPSSSSPPTPKSLELRCLHRIIYSLSPPQYIFTLQSLSLRSACRQKGLPLLFLHRQVPVLEKPTMAAKIIRKEKSEIAGKEGGIGKGMRKGGVMVEKGVREKLNEIKKAEEEEKRVSRRFKKKKAKGPNPLSIRKKERENPNETKKGNDKDNNKNNKSDKNKKILSNKEKQQKEEKKSDPNNNSKISNPSSSLSFSSSSSSSSSPSSTSSPTVATSSSPDPSPSPSTNTNRKRNRQPHHAKSSSSSSSLSPSPSPTNDHLMSDVGGNPKSENAKEKDGEHKAKKAKKEKAKE